MSNHARLRCEQMGISTKVAKRIVRSHDVAWTDADGRSVATSEAHPDLAVVYADGVVITVLYRTQNAYVRPT
jgi:hypothetical protein